MQKLWQRQREANQQRRMQIAQASDALVGDRQGMRSETLGQSRADLFGATVHLPGHEEGIELNVNLMMVAGDLVRKKLMGVKAASWIARGHV